MKNNRVFSPVVTLGPVGYIRGGGTLATLVTAPFFLTARFFFGVSSVWFLLIISWTLLGVVTIRRLVSFQELEQDPSCIVLDEVIGALWLCLFPITSFWDGCLRILLFRFFDISKIGISACERLPGVWGVVADDVAAALLGVFLSYALFTKMSFLYSLGASLFS